MAQNGASKIVVTMKVRPFIHSKLVQGRVINPMLAMLLSLFCFQMRFRTYGTG
jgi:hypothetical protein